MFEATVLEIRFKFSMDMCWQGLALSIEFFNQGGVVFLYKLVEQSLLWAMAFIGGVTKGILQIEAIPDPQAASTDTRERASYSGMALEKL